MEKESKIVEQFEHKGKHVIIILHEFGHHCAYVNSTLKNKRYSSDERISPERIMRVHGGITFSGDLKNFGLKDFYYGIDFAHCFDFDDNLRIYTRTLDEVRESAKELAEEVIKYEKIYPKLVKIQEGYENQIELLKQEMDKKIEEINNG